MTAGYDRLSGEDQRAFLNYVGKEREPDLIIAPDGQDYLYRWHLKPRSLTEPNLYFHIQVASDGERELHDHPWDNKSTLLAGGYIEVLQHEPPHGPRVYLARKKGDVVHRKADWAHRLILPATLPYSMTLFETGPKVREWGFWQGDTWVHNTEEVIAIDGRSMSPRLIEGEKI